MDVVIPTLVTDKANVDLEDSNQNKPQETNTETKNNLLPDLEPLATTSVSISQLWRLVREQLEELSAALTGTSQENTNTKKTLIEVQKDSQIKLLQERESQLIKQNASNTAMDVFGKVAIALGVVGALILAPFNPVASAIMIGGMIASLVVPVIVDKILAAAGVSDDIRGKVKMGLEIGLGLASMLASFNPVTFVKNITNAASSLAKNAVALAQKIVAEAKNLLTSLQNINWANITKSATNLSSQLSTKLINLTSQVKQAINELFIAAKNLAGQTANSVKVATAQAIDKLQEAISQASDTIKALKDSAVELLQQAGETLSNTNTITAFISKATEAIKMLDEAGAIIKTLTNKLIDSIKNTINRIETSINNLSSMTPTELLDKTKELIAQAKQGIINLSTDYSQTAAIRMNRVAQISSEASDTIKTGFGINSANIKKETEIMEAKQEALLATVASIIDMIDRALETLGASLQAVIRVNDHYQDYRQRNN